MPQSMLAIRTSDIKKKRDATHPVPTPMCFFSNRHHLGSAPAFVSFCALLWSNIIVANFYYNSLINNINISKSLKTWFKKKTKPFTWEDVFFKHQLFISVIHLL